VLLLQYQIIKKKKEMNKIRRKELEKATSLLNDASVLLEEIMGIIEAAKDEEQECYDNLSEGLQASEKGQKYEENSILLDEAFSSVDQALSACNSAIENIETASE
jgi:hypothetical protein